MKGSQMKRQIMEQHLLVINNYYFVSFGGFLWQKNIKI